MNPARIASCVVVQLCVACGAAPARAAGEPNVDWPAVYNDKAGTRFSSLEQINRESVSKLGVAWTFHTGDAGEGTTIECTPLVVDGVMYVTTVRTKVVALDAATGKEIWRFDPYSDSKRKFNRASGGVNRGLAYWSDGNPRGERRLILGASDGRLISLATTTGKPDPNFGTNGELDLRADIPGEADNAPYGPTSAPIVFENLVIVGCSTNEAEPAGPGDPRAFDVRTGKPVWRFHTIPRDDEFGRDTWPAGTEPWKAHGAANPWGGFTLDEEAGVLFCATGSATSDFYGADRIGNNLFANCVLALDARTGKRLWHFQTTRHDLWDHDNPCPPVLVDVRRDGKPVKAVAQLTKTGFCWLLDRKTGKPLFGMKDAPAATSDVPGEEASPTQPEPLKPPALSRTLFTKDEVTDITPESRASVIKQLETLRYGEPYTPPSVKGSVIAPGFHGGATWSGGSYDAKRGLLYVNTNNTPYIARLMKRPDGKYVPSGYLYLLDDEGNPGIRPPWGQLTAIDVNNGDFAWRVTLGETPALKEKGVLSTGTENFGGTIVTAGGLVFIGGTKDEMFHAFDASNGKLLWQQHLPAGGYATPCTYRVKGRQFVCIAAGGGGKLKTRSGDAFVAFALP